MKKYLTILPVFFLLAFTTTNSISEIINAFKEGNASAISASFDQTVEITFLSQNNSYSKSKAQKVLQDFFAANTVRDFKVLHKSDSGGSAYFIGNLITSNGNFRVTVYAKEKNGKILIQELRIEK